MIMNAKPGRVRVTQACEGCRVKRTKCDGSKPVCGGCRYRQEECKYDQTPSQRRPPSKRYVQALEARIMSLEEQVRELTAERDAARTGIKVETINPQPPRQMQLPSPPLPEKDPMKLPVRSRVESNDPNDLADVLGSFNLDDGGELRFFGAASNFHLIRDKDTFKDSSSTVARAQGIKAAQRSVGSLPTDTPEELRDHLLDLYWRWQNSWQYVVARSVFMRDLGAGKSTRFCSPLLLAAILALASRYSDRVEVRADANDSNTAGAMFAAQAKAMLHHECVAPTVATVQATALLGLYSCAINQESLGWMYTGMAVRMAFSLGLHLDCSQYVASGLITTDDLESRNVTWWGVFLLDHLFTVGIGRPCTIRDEDVTASYPSLAGDAPIPATSRAMGDAPSCRNYNTSENSHIATTAIYIRKLLSIVSVLSPLYAVNPCWTKAERKRRVMAAHLELTSFFDNLPHRMRLPSSPSQPAMPNIYVFHIQYHTSVILLHRPFFPTFRQSAASAKILDAEAELHARACRTSAEKICSLIRVFKAHYTLRYFPISVVHSTFTAAVIHLLDFIHTEGQARLKAKHRLETCTRAMEEMRKTWAWSGRCLRSLVSLVKEWNVDLDIMQGFAAGPSEDSPASSGSDCYPTPTPMAAAAAAVAACHAVPDCSGCSPRAWDDGFQSPAVCNAGQSMMQQQQQQQQQHGPTADNGLVWTNVGGFGTLNEWAVEVPGSDQFDATFVDHWWEDASMW